MITEKLGQRERETSEEPPMATKHRPGNDSKQNYEVLRRNQFHFF